LDKAVILLEGMEMDDSKTGIESLEIWQMAIRFSVDVCKLILPKFPPEEKWGLTSQLRRSVQSIPANIAEGYGRYYYTETVRFCYIARGSLEETYSHLVMAVRLGYVSEVETKAIFSEIVRLRQMINGYIAFLKRIKRGDKEPGAASQVREPHFDYLFGDSIDETDEDSLFSESPNTENTPEHEGKQD